MPITVLTVIGARPQFIKASAVARAFEKAGVREILVHTGQHYDDNMSDVFFRELGIPEPAINLGIGGESHGAMTGHLLVALEREMIAARPDMVLVYGDTNSTLAGALAAAKLHIPVAHVEAGLRSFNRRMPEEVNRVLTDHASSLLFTPNEGAATNLANEGITGPMVAVVGDVMYDVALYHRHRCSADGLAAWGLQSKRYALATIHRQENTDDPARLVAIFSSLADLASTLPIVIPMHPRTRTALDRAAETRALAERLRVIPPVGYLDMSTLERHASLVITDSGGVQKEAFFHGVPCVTVRDETEWKELVDLGWNHLADPSDANRIASTCLAVLRDGGGVAGTPFGDGHSADLIANRIQQWRN